MTHLLQDLVVDRALGGLGESVRFRSQLLAKAEGKVKRYLPSKAGERCAPLPSRSSPAARRAEHHLRRRYDPVDTTKLVYHESEMTTGDYVWRFTYDLFMRSRCSRDFAQLPQAERLRPALNELDLGLL